MKIAIIKVFEFSIFLPIGDAVSLSNWLGQKILKIPLENN
jgi:hypothetical protein